MRVKGEPRGSEWGAGKHTRNEPLEGAPPAPDVGEIPPLKLVHGPEAPAAGDRRAAPRFAAVENQVWLGWWENRTWFHVTPARVVNVSRTGALACTEAPPPQDRPVWLGHSAQGPAELLEVVVIEVAEAPHSCQAVRLAFRAPCPPHLFRALVDGPWPSSPVFQPFVEPRPRRG